MRASRKELDNAPLLLFVFLLFVLLLLRLSNCFCCDILNHSIGLDRMDWRYRTSHGISRDVTGTISFITSLILNHQVSTRNPITYITQS